MSLIIALLVLVAFVFIESCFFAPKSCCALPPLKKFANPLGPCALPEISPAACNALVSSPFGGAIFGFCCPSPATTNSPLLFIKPGRPFLVANPDNAMSPAVFGSQPVKLANPPFCLTAAAASAACFSAAATSANVNASCKEGLDSI